ncbi:hypothetical protein VNO77_32512 [Canavalia gladiata]|uniref:Uncharacterized protein n=1 Tax=Canavalia gladiata TaxID=3824 RepID=A0AAN9KQS2_CANGL
MHFHHYSLHGGFNFKRLMVFLLLTIFLVSAQKQDPSLVAAQSYQPHNVPQKQHQQFNPPTYPFGVYFSQKRKVPNASDPLHNR